MRRHEHQVARVLTALGLAATAAYLVWRAAVSMRHSPWYLAAPLYAVELAGFLAALVLAWALWPLPRRGADEIDDDPDAAVAAAAAIGLSASDVVVRAGTRPVHELRATLLALRSVRHIGGVVVLAKTGRDDAAALLAETPTAAARLVTIDGPEDELRSILAAVTSPTFLLLDAGDIPSPDIVGLLAGHMVDADVTVVQGYGHTLADDAADRRPDRSREPRFEHEGLNPALGRRRVAVWTGSGSLVRTDDLRAVAETIPDAAASLEMQWAVTRELLATGRRIVAPVTPVMATSGPVDDATIYVDRVEHAPPGNCWWRPVVRGDGARCR